MSEAPRLGEPRWIPAAVRMRATVALALFGLIVARAVNAFD
jgi:hypothetical protein